MFNVNFSLACQGKTRTVRAVVQLVQKRTGN